MGEVAQMGDRLAHPRLEQGVIGLLGEIGELDPRRRGFEMAELAKLLGGHGDLVGPAPAEHVDRPDRARLEGV